MSENVVQFASYGDAKPGDETGLDESGAESASVYNPETFFYPTPALEKLTEALVRSVNDKGFLTVIKGEQGSGKTTLLRQFLRQIQPEWALCLIQVNHVIGEKHILEQLNNHFFPYNHYDVETLAERLLATTDPCWPVILVDDAHNLSSFALNVLLSLKFNVEEQGGRLGLILFALPSIQEVMSSPSLLRHDEIVRVIDMPTLLEQETMAYIDQLLEASAQAAPPGLNLSLASGQKRMIFRRSGGHPGRINELVVHTVKRRGRKPSPLFTLLRHMLLQPRLWIAAAVLLLLVYAGFSWLSSELNDNASVSPVAELSRQTIQQQEPVKNDQRPLAAAVNKASPAPKVTEKSPVPQAAKPAMPAPTAVVKKPLRPVTAQAGRDHPVAVAPEKPQPEKPQADQPQLSPPTVAGATKAADKPVVSAKTNEPIDGQKWLLAQNRGDYTIQLAASAYEDAIERFIRKQPVMDSLRYVHIVRRGKDWYVSLFGSYTTFAKAQQAIADLPESLRKNSPWIRRISALQAMLPAPVPAPAPDAVLEVIPAVPEKAADLPPPSVPVQSQAVLDNAGTSAANDDVEPAMISSGSAATPAANASQSE